MTEGWCLLGAPSSSFQMNMGWGGVGVRQHFAQGPVTLYWTPVCFSVLRAGGMEASPRVTSGPG